MRVSKKYSGESWSHHGKRPYRHVAAPDQRVVEELWLLEHAFHRSLRPGSVLTTSLLGASGLATIVSERQWVRVEPPPAPSRAKRPRDEAPSYDPFADPAYAYAAAAAPPAPPPYAYAPPPPAAPYAAPPAPAPSAAAALHAAAAAAVAASPLAEDMPAPAAAFPFNVASSSSSPSTAVRTEAQRLIDDLHAALAGPTPPTLEDLQRTAPDLYQKALAAAADRLARRE